MGWRFSWFVILSLGSLMAPGCTGLFTKSAIERFAVSMQEQDLEKLKSMTSDDFEQKALRQEDSAKGLKMLKLPIGKVEIVSVEDLPDGKRKAHVKVGEKDKVKELDYVFSRNKNGHGWVVDDIIMPQDSGNGQIVERSVTEQMDLLLTCRELLLSWRGKESAEKLSFCDTKLKAQLEPLPTVWLDQMFKEIAGPGHQSTFKPDARLNGNTAFIVVPHPDGNLYLELMQENDKWLLHDLAIEPKSKDSTGIRSLMKMVAALGQSSRFLKAYEQEDRDSLDELASKHLYKCLLGADFKSVPVPGSALLESAYEARQYTDGTDSIKRVELLVKDDSQTYMLTLREEEIPQTEASKKVTEFRVDEVTLFEKGSRDVKRMSSMYLSRAIANAYMAALVDRNISRLKEMSSTNFNDRVWNRPESKHFAIMPDPRLEPGEPQILSTIFRGDISEITLIQGNTPLSLILHQANGWMVVDDVLLPAIDRPTSLKANLEVLLTVHAFASAVHRRDLEELIRHSADGLDRIAWRQLTSVPDLAQQLVRPLLSEVIALQPGEAFTLVRTSNGEIQAEIKLVHEGEKYVVHDVALTSTAVPDQKFELLPTIRHMIAAGQLGPANKRTGQIQPVHGVRATSPTVRRADFEPVEIETEPQAIVK